uniref:IlGF domain-containing protein n=1 Tax=Steinernema glaseri TaxID=37863 RepID=A0A1I7ZLE6_9BILA
MAKIVVLVLLAAMLAFGPNNSAHALRVCGTKLTALLVRTCTFRDEQWPCFKGERFYKDGYKSKGLELKTSTRVGVATDCCDNHCEITAITKRCCFTIACLENCYPDSGYQEVDGEILDVREETTTPTYDDEYPDGEGSSSAESSSSSSSSQGI